ncbi:MAG: hypothetical protein NWF14_00880 [Candidatus Bathyarchaeota archaeon]|nr:hypothetical protein [Candidatus Bathyarchaeota archaeon]
MKCQHCDKNVDLPFKCPFCGGYFCADHRLPENHACPELWKARTRQPPPLEKPYPSPVEGKPETSKKEPPVSYPLRFKRAGWTSPTEIVHLAAGAVIIMAVGLSMGNGGFGWVWRIFTEPATALISALVFTGIFVSHELAHKVAARHYGLWAEFRLSLIGAVFTLMSIASTLIKIVSPGAVTIAGAADKRTVGITALAGPFTSLVFTSLLLVLHFFVPDSSFALTILEGAWLSAWIALLNLIPFGILDGAKVIWWSKSVWATSFTASAVLALVTLRYLPLT